MTLRRMLYLAAVLAILSASSAMLWGQTSFGGVNGTVSDGSGAVVPGANVVLTNADTAIDNDTTTNGSGFFTFVNLRPGRYSLKIESPGFKAVEVPVFPVGTNQTVVQNVALEVGAVTETVEVTTQGELLQASSAELGNVIEEEVVHDLPLNGRNFTQLILLNTGVSPVSTAQGDKREMGFGTEGNTGLPGSTIANASIQGQQNRSKVYYYDGIINTSIRGTSYTVVPDIDMIQEFKVQAHNDKAEYGGVTGGVVNMTSKSGTNRFHGSGVWLVRNDFFDARDPFADSQRTDPPPFRQNQFAVSGGGPIVRNKTFFYAGYDGWRYRDVDNQQLQVPTDAIVSGDFSNSFYGKDIFNPFSQRVNSAGELVRDQFANNTIPSSMINQQMSGLLDTYRVRPNLGGDPSYNFRQQRSRKHDANSYQIRLDHHFSTKDNVFFRWNEQRLNILDPTGDRSGTTRDGINRNYGGGWIHSFSPTVILELRGGAATQPNTSINNQHEAGLEPIQQLGFADLDRFGGLEVQTEGTPWSGVTYGVGGPSDRDNPNYSFSSNLTFIRGNHNMKTGFQYVRNDRLQVNNAQTFEFDNVTTDNPLATGTAGDDIASILLGTPSRYQGQGPEFGSLQFYIQSWAAFLQDEWKVRPNFTMTWGLRYDYVTRSIGKTDAMMQSGPDMATGDWLIALPELPGPCAQVRSSPCIPHDSIQEVSSYERIKVTGARNNLLSPIRNNWGPRLGFAWQVDPKTVVRGGYALMWDAFASRGQYSQHQFEFWGWPQSSGFDTGVVNRLSDDIQTVDQLQGAFPIVQPQPEPWNASGWFNDPERGNSHSHQWNIEIQRQLSTSVMGSLAYVGSDTGGLEYTGMFNVGAPGPGTPDEVNARRPWPHMKAEALWETSTGFASYHSLQAKLNKRYDNGMALLLSYTWSKSIDTSSGWFGTENEIGGRGVQNFHDIQSNKGLSGYDVPHILTAGFLWDLPIGRGKPHLSGGPLANVLGNWQMNWLVTARAGQPVTPDVGGDLANVGGRSGWNYMRPDLIGDPNLSNPTAERWFNADAFAIPRFRYGTAGRSLFRTDDEYNFDFSLFKKIPFGETKVLTLRFEAFNIFNHIDLGSPSTRVDQPNPGRITSAAHNPRQMQFGVKYVF